MFLITRHNFTPVIVLPDMDVVQQWITGQILKEKYGGYEITEDNLYFFIEEDGDYDNLDEYHLYEFEVGQPFPYIW